MKHIGTSNIIAALCIIICIFALTIGAKSNSEINPELSNSDCKILTEELRETNNQLASLNENLKTLNTTLKNSGSGDYTEILTRIADSIKHPKDKSPETVVELLHRIH